MTTLYHYPSFPCFSGQNFGSDAARGINHGTHRKHGRNFYLNPSSLFRVFRGLSLLANALVTAMPRRAVRGKKQQTDPLLKSSTARIDSGLLVSINEGL
ncbi:MAG: hypothetical protein PF795_13700 [Kiritimatiellae bacterium]|jgi:hypothetical protein|nr:hypothetical protein [Kiritimatiellia bacterium]